MGLFLYYLVLSILRGALTFNFLQANGIARWQAFVPVLRTVRLLEVADRPRWWAFLFYIPVVDNVMSIILSYELLHMHGYRENKHILYTLGTLGGYLGWINATQPLVRKDRDNALILKRIGITINSILFAVVAAGSLRMIAFEAYNIPTSSMEKSLMVGDYLVVSKLHYGLRIPMTPLSIPLMHNVIPSTTLPSFLSLVQLPYLRLPAISPIVRGDAVVFNYPQDPGRPIDKKENYVKRCVATPGDTLSIVNRTVFINGEESPLPDRSNGQFSYYVQSNQGFNPVQLKRDFDINYYPDNYRINNQDVSDVLQLSANEYIATIPDDALEAFSKQPGLLALQPVVSPVKGLIPAGTPSSYAWYVQQVDQTPVFPNPTGGHQDTLVFPWTRDFYGPLWIPEKGATVSLTYENVLKYGRCIEVYEGHTLERTSDGSYKLDGVSAQNYTFSLDYYWLMGDNRHNSYDSRYWGFVPEDHVVGKPVFIFMSMESLANQRWNRWFTVIHGDGPSRSYWWPAFAVGMLIYVYTEWRKRRKAKSAK